MRGSPRDFSKVLGLTVFVAPGQDYALPIEAVGRNRIRIQPDRKQSRGLLVLSAVKCSMKTKNMEVIKALLDIAITEGNNLKGSWREVLQCVSQIDHMELISSGHDIPDGRRG